MTRLIELEDLLFDVELRPLFTRIGDRDVPARDSQAVVDVKANRVVSVVGRGYRLVTHKAALDLAFDCAASAFPETKADYWNVMVVDGPSTGGTCYIDLNHNTSALDFSGVAANDKPEAYGPFVRVVNSYNRTRALSFEIGYYRKVCKNGLILRNSLIQFKMSHQRRDIGETVRFVIDQDKLGKQRKDFQDFLAKLQACEIPAPLVSGFSCLVLGFKQPDVPPNALDQRWIAWRNLEKIVSLASERYVGELGANANAVMNVVTDIASRPPQNSAVRRDKNSLQRLAGQWVSDFSAVCGTDGFDLGAYLEGFQLAAAGAGQRGRGVAVT